MLCFNGTATSGSYTSLHTLSLHDALPISRVICTLAQGRAVALSAANSGTGERPPETASPARSVAAMLCRRAADISRTMAWMYSWFELNSCHISGFLLPDYSGAGQQAAGCGRPPTAGGLGFGRDGILVPAPPTGRASGGERG